MQDYTALVRLLARAARGVCALALISFGVANAHEIGTTRVSATLSQGSNYDIEIVTDATALGDKLAAASGTRVASKPDAATLQAFISNRDPAFRQRIKVAFDGNAVQPSMTYVVTPPADATSVPAATIHFTGPIPAGAQQFSWSFGWTFASYALEIRKDPRENPVTEWLEGDQSSKPFAMAAPIQRTNRLQTALLYLKLGFTHIVPLGLDHMLFVLGIYLLSGRLRSVLLQVSAFTVAHSITLGLSMYGLVNVSSRVVEPMIAISIAYVAIENIFQAELKSWRVALVFAFGLLHGMGFAGALKELGLPRSEFVTALLTFNIGVEAGQLAVIGTAFLLVGWHWSERTWYRARVVVPASIAIACTAIYWTVQRIML
jgi:hydrogenase/urease accessory protein HupE